MKTGLDLIAEERNAHLSREGWTAERDDAYIDEQLAEAAACYATPFHDRPFSVRDGQLPLIWPWEKKWWKPTPENRIRELQKAGALIAAEIDRLLRAEETL